MDKKMFIIHSFNIIIYIQPENVDLYSVHQSFIPKLKIEFYKFQLILRLWNLDGHNARRIALHYRKLIPEQIPDQILGTERE